MVVAAAGVLPGQRRIADGEGVALGGILGDARAVFVLVAGDLELEIRAFEALQVVYGNGQRASHQPVVDVAVLELVFEVVGHVAFLV